MAGEGWSGGYRNKFNSKVIERRMTHKKKEKNAYRSKQKTSGSGSCFVIQIKEWSSACVSVPSALKRAVP